MKIKSNREPRIVWTRIMARFMFANAIFALVVLLQSNTTSRVAIISELSRISCYVLFFLLNLARKNKRFYIPILSEMSVFDYWGFASIVLVILRLIVSDSSSRYGAVFQALDIMFSSFGVTFLFMVYARQEWTIKDEQLREKRTLFLIRKASISKSDLLSIKDDLIEAARKKQKPPFTWSAALWAISFIVGLLINNYTSYIAEQIKIP